MIIKNNNTKNDDWMKTLPGYQDELAIHERLAKKHVTVTLKGGPNSGFHGHAGRPGKRGGSAPSGTSKYANSNGKDTMEKYRYPDGSWTPEREALHKQIIDSFFAGKTPVDNPTSYILGGGPASGKTTLVKSNKSGWPTNMVISNSDDVKEMIPEYQEMLKAGDTNAAMFSHEESSYIAKKIAARASEGSYNTMLDGTGDNNIDNLQRKVDSLRPLGQRVEAIYVTVDIATALERNIARAQRTGRYVPESVIKETHRGVAGIFPQAVSRGMFDKIELYNSTPGGFKLIAGGSGTKLEIFDQDMYDEFLNRGK